MQDLVLLLCEYESSLNGLEWEVWLGQAPEKSYCEAKFNRPNAWWDCGGGRATNWGADYIDSGLWGMGEDCINHFV